MSATKEPPLPPTAAIRRLLVFAATVIATPALATTADDLCAPSANPCTITGTKTVTPGSVIDVGSRRLSILGTLNLTSGAMTLRAGEFRIESGGKLQGKGTTSIAGATITVVADSVLAAGRADLSGAPGGTLIITSSGPLIVTGSIDAFSNAQSGGAVSLTGTDVTISGSVDVHGGPDSFGGDVKVIASGSLSLGGSLTATGGDGGSVTLTSAGAATVSASAVVTTSASRTAGSGGEITATAGGDLVIEGDLTANGRSGNADDGGGDGGSISLTGASIRAERAANRIAAVAGSPDGVGGEIELIADIGDLSLRGRIDASSPGSDGSGGTISLDAGGAIALGGSIQIGGGADGGGDVDISSETTITVAAGATVNAAASGTGGGGTIDLDGAEVVVAGSLIADGGNTAGSTGGSIRLTACELRIATGGRLSSLRPSGDNTLVGRDHSSIAGTLRADVATGLNRARYAGPGHAPQILAGASIQPALTLVQDAAIIPCAGVDTPTPTPTVTVTVPPGSTDTATPPPTPTGDAPNGSPSETPTPTPTPPFCVGDCTGDGSVSVADLIVGVNIALGNQPVDNCPAFDVNGDGMVSISELIQAVGNALDGC
ncbi:hypothetical protein KF840_06420 [bacterium]|nr:hypothetical protein [bacterium]